jgi:hypothetical protein
MTTTLANGPMPADSLAELRDRLTMRRRQLLEELATGPLDSGYLVLLGHVHLALEALEDAESAP